MNRISYLNVLFFFGSLYVMLHIVCSLFNLLPIITPFVPRGVGRMVRKIYEQAVEAERVESYSTIPHMMGQTKNNLCMESFHKLTTKLHCSSY